MKDSDLLAICAAILASDKPEMPSDLFDRAAHLVVAARKYVAENQKTQVLKMDYEIATLGPDAILKGKG